MDNIMGITLEQIKKDIESGKSDKIYYSSATTWWTHLEEDLIDAKKKSPHPNAHIQLDPSGAPLFQANIKLALKQSIKQQDSYGENKINAWIKAHHQNCEGICWKNWDDVNDYINKSKE